MFLVAIRKMPIVHSVNWFVDVTESDLKTWMVHSDPDEHILEAVRSIIEDEMKVRLKQIRGGPIPIIIRSLSAKMFLIDEHLGRRMVNIEDNLWHTEWNDERYLHN